jgi:hypothetical protein
LRNLRGQETLNNYNYVNKLNFDKDFETIEVKNCDWIQDIAVKENTGIPKTYSHMLTEIRILFRGREKKEEKAINSLLGSLSKKIG